MAIYMPYTYLIGWSNHDLWYYGVRYSKNCHPNDLWSSYFTSSKYVKEYRKSYGEPDIIEIRKTFSDEKSARLWENKVLSRLKVVSSDKWINKRLGTTWDGFTTKGMEPPNKIHETYFIQCEFCNKIKEYTAYNNKKGNKKTCGSKSCAAKWSSKYKPRKIYIAHNKIIKTFIWKCRFCNRSENRRDTVKERKKLFCNKSCAASYSNLHGGRSKSRYNHCNR